MMQELRYALRRVMRQPGATLIAMVTLAAAIGAATATWTLVAATILHPVPGASTGGWHAVHVERDDREPRFDVSFPALRFVEDTAAFERVEAAWRTPEHLRLSRPGTSRYVDAAFVTHGCCPASGGAASRTRVHGGRRSPRRGAGRAVDRSRLAGGVRADPPSGMKTPPLTSART